MAQRAAEQRRPSIHDVASRAGVSAATVSKVMQGVTTVRPENAQRVFDAIQLLGYRVDPLASDLRRAKRRIIGAIVPEFESEFFGSMVTQLERLAEQRGYSLIAASSRESEARERDILDRMHDWRVSGVVLSPVRNEHGPAAELMKQYGARLHPMTRPNFVEAEAIQRAVQWCEATGGKLYIVHMSTGEGADIIRAAQARGVPVIAETCVQYLVLDDSVFEREDGHLFACCPQLKKPKDVDRLWQGLIGGEVSVISTDTCTFTREQKAMWEGDWTKIPMGMPGLETLLPLTYTHGVLGGRLSIEEMCMKLSTNPARIMGLAPRKGAIAIGADADLAIIHPTRKHTVDPSAMETNADWSPFEGWDLAGFARTTVSRGETIVDGYQVVGREGGGIWLRRDVSPVEREQGTGNREPKTADSTQPAASVPGSQLSVPAGAAAR